MTARHADADALDGALTRRTAETYYDLPVVKPAPWKWYVPAYFYLGGVAGAAAALAAAAELAGERRLARQLHAIATVGEAAGAACLIADLGAPARAHHMMRVFRPTSPMNLGTWILSAASASGGLALLGDLRGRPGLGAAGAASAVSGAMLSTYTGVLIGNTAIPIWRATRRRLPMWFAAASAASLASLLELLGLVGRGRGRPSLAGYRVVAKAAELAGSIAVARAAAAAGVAQPLRLRRAGPAAPALDPALPARPAAGAGTGWMWRGATWLGAASLVATLVRRPRLAGALGTAAGVLARFAIVEAGRASAADPSATFGPQRRALARAQAPRRPAPRLQ